MLPHPIAQPTPETLQRTAGSGCPFVLIAETNRCVVPRSREATDGETVSAMSLRMATGDVADFVASARLVAAICTTGTVGKSTGATYVPSELIVPKVAFPPGIPFTLQV